MKWFGSWSGEPPRNNQYVYIVDYISSNEVNHKSDPAVHFWTIPKQATVRKRKWVQSTLATSPKGLNAKTSVSLCRIGTQIVLRGTKDGIPYTRFTSWYQGYQAEVPDTGYNRPPSFPEECLGTYSRGCSQVKVRFNIQSLLNKEEEAIFRLHEARQSG